MSIELENIPEEFRLTDEERARLNGPDSVDDLSAEMPEDSTGDTDEGQELQDREVEQERPSETQAATQADSWVNQNVLSYAETYGLNEEDVRAFGSQAELEKHAALLDKYAGKLFAAPDEQQPAPTQAAYEQTKPAADQPDRPGFKDGRIDVEYFKQNYSEDDPAFALVEHTARVQAELQKFQAEHQAVVGYLARQEQANQANAFHSAVDAYNAKFFGKAFDGNGAPAKMSDEALQRRGKILDTVMNDIMPLVTRQQQAGLLSNVPTYPELVHRAARARFGKELDELASKERAEELKKQSLKRRSVGNSSNGYRPRTGSKGPVSEAERLKNLPQLIDAWDGLVKDGLVAAGG